MIGNRGIIFVFLTLTIISTVFAASSSTPTIENVNAPTIENIHTIGTTDTSTTIAFTLNQSDAHTRINYGKTPSLGIWSGWNNDTGTARNITLSGLSNDTTYSYEVYAYNGSNQSAFSQSTIQNFKTNISTNTTVQNGTDSTNATAPNITNINVTGTTSSTANISFSVDQNNADTRINYGTTASLGAWSDWNNNTGTARNITLFGLLNGTTYSYDVYAYNGSNQSAFSQSTIQNFATISTTPSVIPPHVVNPSPGQTVQTTIKDSTNFTISFDQIVDVTWSLNGTQVKTDNSITSSFYLVTPSNTPSQGSWNLTATGNNTNGTVSYSWTWTVEPQTFNVGNRIWDESKNMNTTYTWNAYSFSGFYYDLNSNLGTENLTIKNIARTINAGNIVYDTSPVEVNFSYPNFGSYQVVGFMADKYFAGYTANTSGGSNPTTPINAVSTIANGQLQKILIDDEDKRTISLGSTLTLQEGYVLKAVDIDPSARTMLLSLLKDGTEVDSSPLSAGQTYIYTKRVGNVDNLPIIMVRFDSVFAGSEVQAAFLKGLFQISEESTSVKTGDTYGSMEISSVGANGIEMTNHDSIGLTAGYTVNLMGSLKIIVADSGTLRFALSVDRTGAFEVRGTVYPVVNTWTPMNFGLNVGNIGTGTGSTNIGFYYDLNAGIGTENLSIENINGATIPAGQLVYSTSPQEVAFQYPGFGSYQVVGFMADKYFAGYTANSTGGLNPTTPINSVSAIANGQLQKVLIDDEDKRTISVGSSLTLQEGYVLKAIDIDLSARTMLLSLLKDGTEVDQTPLSAGQTYVYTKKVGNVDNLPIIMARFDSVFSGTEVQAAFLKGLFQISEASTSVKTGDTYRLMSVTSVGADGIQMDNPNAIGMTAGNNLSLMGNINFKVADSSDVRFYPYVLVTPEMVANQLIVQAPAKATAGDTISINVTAGGVPVEGVSIDIEPQIGLTGNNSDKNGILNFTFPILSKGMYNITATKLGYQNGNDTINIERFISERLVITVPSTADQSETVPIHVMSNGTDINNVSITYDNTTIGQTDKNGTLNYTLESSGVHNISASKIGYITATIDINVRAPYSDFEAQNINIKPNSTFINDNVLITSNIVNAGTKVDNKSIDLIINGSVVDNRSVLLNPKEAKEINFTYKASLLKGNYTVEILGQKGLLEVKEAPYNILWIAALLTIIGAIAIYAFTSKDKIIEFRNQYITKENLAVYKDKIVGLVRTKKDIGQQDAIKKDTIGPIQKDTVPLGTIGPQDTIKKDTVGPVQKDTVGSVQKDTIGPQDTNIKSNKKTRKYKNI